MASAATVSHHLPGNLLAAAVGGAHDEEGDGVVLKLAGPGEPNLKLLPHFLVPGSASLVVLSPDSRRLSWTEEKLAPIF